MTCEPTEAEMRALDAAATAPASTVTGVFDDNTPVILIADPATPQNQAVLTH